MTQRIKVTKQKDSNYASEFGVCISHMDRFTSLCEALLKHQPVGTILEITVNITLPATSGTGEPQQ